MHHVADVGLVDAHAEGVGGHHDRGRIVHEGPLVALALLGGEPRVVAGGRDAALAQVVAHLLHRRPLGAVDDARLGPSLVDEGIQARQLLLGLAPLHRETQVGPVEARDRAGRVAQAQKAHDVAAHQIGGRGRERRHGRADGQLSDELADGEVRGAEVLTPLGHAVGLVHGDQREPRRTGELGEARIGQALGSHVHEVVGALGRPAQHLGLLSGRQRGIQVRPADARFLHGPNLVGHERHERAHDERHALHDDGRHLVAHRLAGTGGHDCQHIATGKERRDHCLLPRTERVVAETARQHSPCLLHLLIHERSPPSVASSFASQYSGYRLYRGRGKAVPKPSSVPGAFPHRPLRRRHCVRLSRIAPTRSAATPTAPARPQQR